MTPITLILISVAIILTIIVIVLIVKLKTGKEDLILHQKLDSFTGQLNNLFEKLGNIDRDSAEILNLTRSFHDILKPTKTRGIFGESILDNLLKDVLPKDVVVAQYGFSNGKKVDFAIKLPENIVPIDAKFSMEVFQNYLNADEQARLKQKKTLSDSIKKRIDETSEYIFPDEGTTDFSLMYVPSEAVYYFIITETELLEYANEKRVFVVGPNTLYAYLKTILVGFEALKVEKKTKEIYNLLRRLESEVSALIQDYGILGTHLKNISGKYDEVRRRIEAVQLKLSNVGSDEDKG